MNEYALLLLALSMSMDAFAVSLAKGAERQYSWGEWALTACIFGFVEGMTPMIGWWFGDAAHTFIQEWDHWVAFTLLSLLGAKMIREGLSEAEDEPSDETLIEQHRWWLVAVTAVATSIDSMVVGVTLAFMAVNITVAAVLIGTSTMIMTAMGLKIGARLGTLIGQRAEVLGGCVLLAIGTLTLISHLNE